jgi:hypothetical protein
MPVQRGVGGVEIEDDLDRRRRRMRAEKEIDNQPLDHRRVIADLVVARRLRERQAKHPLPHQGRHFVRDQFGRALVGEPAGKPLDQPDRPVGGAKQQRAGLRGHLAAVKRGHHRAPCDGCKTKQIRATLGLRRAPPVPETNRFHITIFSDPGPRCTTPLRNPG